MKRRTLSRNIAAIVSVVLLMGLTGCKNASKTEEPAPENTSVEAAEETDKQTDKQTSEGPITIGLVCPVTGNLAEYGKAFQVAAQIACDEINAAGGIGGREITFTVGDSKSDPTEGTETARKMVANEDVVAVIGDYSSSGCMAAAPVYEEAKLVQFSPTCNHGDFGPMGPYQFGIMGVSTDVAPYIVKSIVADYLGASSMALLYTNNETGNTSLECCTQACEERGLELTISEPFNAGDSDFVATLNKIRQTNPEVLVACGSGEDYVKIKQQAVQMGWDIEIVGQGIYSNQTITLGGDAVEGALTTTPFIITGDRQDQLDFAKTYEEIAEMPATVHVFNVYDSFMIMAEALRACGDNITRETVRDALGAIDYYEGISGNLSFTENGDVHREYATIAIENGEWKMVVDFSGEVVEPYVKD